MPKKSIPKCSFLSITGIIQEKYTQLTVWQLPFSIAFGKTVTKISKIFMPKNKHSSKIKLKSIKKEFKIKPKNSNNYNKRLKLKNKPTLIRKYYSLLKLER